MATTKKRATSAKKAPAKVTAKAPAKSASKAAQNINFKSTKSVRPVASVAQTAARAGTETVRNFISNGAEEAQKAQDKVLAISREGVEHIARSADAATRTLNEAVALGRDNIEAYVESGNVAANISKTLSSELFNYINNSFSQNVEISKELFGCRTINDMFDLQSRLIKNNLDNFFTESARMSELLFQFASEAAEPLNERVAEAAERFSRSLAA